MPYELCPGVYAYTNDYPIEAAINYQLGYLVETALFSIKKLFESDKQEMKQFGNEIQYYHYYLDHLLFCMGQINDHLVIKSKDHPLNHIKLINQRNYEFEEKNYPQLSDKRPRNLMEHLLERNLKTISSRGAVGGFNALIVDANEDLKRNIQEHKEYYPYTLDLGNKSIIVADNENKDDGSVVYYRVKLDDLENELIKLKKRIETMKDILNSRYK